MNREVLLRALRHVKRPDMRVTVHTSDDRDRVEGVVREVTEDLDGVGLAHDVLLFVGGILKETPYDERKDVTYLFVEVDDGTVLDTFPFLRGATPDIADPQFVTSGWVRSMRDGYTFYQYRKGIPSNVPVPKPMKGL